MTIYQQIYYTSLPSPPLTQQPIINDNNNVDQYNTNMISPISGSSKQLDKNHDLFDLQLKPLLLNNKYESLNHSTYSYDYQQQQDDILLPSIHKVMTPPLSSKNSPPLSYHEPQNNNNNDSSFFSSSTSVQPSDIPTPPYSDLCLSPKSSSSNHQQRKGSIASLLNSDPELKSLDEEEYKCGYQSHFINHDMKRRYLDNDQQSWLPDQASKRKKYDKQKNKNKNKLNNEENISLANHFSSSESSSLSSTTSSPILSSSSSSTSTSTTLSSSMLMGERATKGLRHFSKQVCDKVKEYGITTHDQVVKELTIDLSTSSCHFDQKNIRRRVYDALNVITAMGIIEKDKKVIKWLGIPNHSINDEENNEEELSSIENDQDHDYLMKQILEEELKQEQLYSTNHTTRKHIQETLTTYLQLCKLIQRNHLNPEMHPPYSHFPLIIIDPLSDDSHSMIETSKDFKQAIITFDHHQPHTFNDLDILKFHFNDHFTSQELSSWLPHPHWQKYLEVS